MREPLVKEFVSDLAGVFLRAALSDFVRDIARQIAAGDIELRQGDVLLIQVKVPDGA